MARMVPPTVPGWVREDPSRRAELKVYEALERQFPDSFVGYYGRTWWDFQSSGKPQLGEADFVVAAPEWGILIIEVKGGRIDRDGVRNIWTSTDRRGEIHRISDPVDQARRSMFVLRNHLRETPWFRAKPLRIGCAVILPDCSRSERLMGLDMPAPLFAWYDDMSNLRERLTQALQSTGALLKIGDQGMKALADLVACSFHLDLSFGSVVERAKRRIKELTEDQFWVLDGLGRSNRAAICGGAGTGKTVLALEKARRLAAHEKTTLLVCYSDGLGARLKKQIADWSLPKLTACTYNEYAESTCQKAGVSISIPSTATEEQKIEYYERRLPEAFWDVLARATSPRLDAVVADEAQDFSELWMETLGLAMGDAQHSYWYAFYDDNQRILGNSLHKDAELGARFGLPFKLTRNLRNTLQVFNVFSKYYKGTDEGAFECRNDVAGKVSFEPQVRDAAGLLDFVSGLIEQKGIAPSDVVLLTCGHLAESHYRVRDVERQLNAKHRGVRASSVAKFKGLESPIVVLTDVAAAAGKPGVLYTAISRAQVWLSVVGASELPS